MYDVMNDLQLLKCCYNDLTVYGVPRGNVVSLCALSQILPIILFTNYSNINETFTIKTFTF